MDYDTDPPDRQAGKHHRQSIRLRGYDYGQAGAYFVTICAQDRACLFGEVEGEQARLNEAGRMVQAVWDELPAHYPGVETDVFVVMPNHIHGIVVIVGATPRGCPDPGNGPCSGQAQGPAPTGNNDANAGQPRGVAPTGCPHDPGNDARSGQARGPAPAGDNDA